MARYESSRRTTKVAGKRMTLRETAEHLMLVRWHGTRGEPTVRVFLEAGVAALHKMKVYYAEDVTIEVAVNLHHQWQREGVSPVLINKRMMYLKTLGVEQTPRAKEPKYRKWWLRPDDYIALRMWLSRWDHAQSGLVSDYIEWAIHTGLRVEESLRLRRADFVALDTAEPSLTVPGTKNDHSGNVTLPITLNMRDLVVRRLGASGGPNDRLFPITYRSLTHLWQYCREIIDAEDTHTATLRSLRRSAARYLHVECEMPLDMVRQYLRHENVKTTMGYLRLTGGYATQEMRKWLAPQVRTTQPEASKPSLPYSDDAPQA